MLLWAIDVVYCGWLVLLFDLLLLYCYVYVCLMFGWLLIDIWMGLVGGLLV